MTEYFEAARLEDAPPPGMGMHVYVGETGIALFNVDGVFYAIHATCIHQGSSLAQGRLNGKIVTCRGHGWKYDVTTGRLTLNPDSGVASYPVQVVDGRIQVALP